MFNPLKQMALYTRDLLSLPESKIKFGESNHERLDFSESIIVIDGLTPSVNIGSQHEYEPISEVKTITKTVSAEIAFNFYGDDALANAQLLATLNETQTAKNLAYKYKINVHRLSGITDLKMLTGSLYVNRYEMTVNVTYNITNESELLRIDSAQFDFLTNNPDGSFNLEVKDEV